MNNHNGLSHDRLVAWLLNNDTCIEAVDRVRELCLSERETIEQYPSYYIEDLSWYASTRIACNTSRANKELFLTSLWDTITGNLLLNASTIIQYPKGDMYLSFKSPSTLAYDDVLIADLRIQGAIMLSRVLGDSLLIKTTYATHNSYEAVLGLSTAVEDEARYLPLIHSIINLAIQLGYTEKQLDKLYRNMAMLAYNSYYAEEKENRHE